MSLKEALLSSPKDGYSDQYQDHILEIYKLYVQSADNISSRRQSTNSFFLTLNTAVIGAAGYIREESGSYGWALSIVGIILCYAWYRLVRSYKDLNSAKFKVIHEIEASLPISVYDAEWESVGRGKNPKLYLPFTNVEIWIPRTFLAFHFAMVLWAAPWALITQWWCVHNLAAIAP